MTEPITSYNRVPPPSNPESSPFHLDGELTKLERTSASIISSINALPATYALITDVAAETAARIAADALKASITYVDTQDGAEATARIAADALKASITYVDTQDGAEAAARIAADALKAPLISPALTGSPTAPTQTAGDNSTKLATTAYADAASPKKISKCTADQTVTGSTTQVTATGMAVPMLANTTYAITIRLIFSFTTGGYSYGVSGPAIGSGKIRFGNSTAYGTIVASAGTTGVAVATVDLVIQNGATAGNFVVVFAEGAATGSVVLEKGSYMEYMVI